MTRSPRPPVGPLADSPSERAILARVRQLYLDIGGAVFSTQQFRRSRQAIGLADLIVMHPRLGVLFFEGKRPGGKQSPGQVAFQQQCERCGVTYLLGGLEEAIADLERRGLIERAPA